MLCPSELIAFQNGFRVVEKKLRASSFSLRINSNTPPWNLFCSRFRSRVEKRATSVVLGRVRALLHAELLQRIDRCLDKRPTLMLFADMSTPSSRNEIALPRIPLNIVAVHDLWPDSKGVTRGRAAAQPRV